MKQNFQKKYEVVTGKTPFFTISPFCRSLLNCVPYVLTCQHTLRAYVLTCLACLRVKVPCVLMYIACLLSNMPCVLMCSRANVLCVLVSCVSTCSRDQVTTCLACLRAITTCDKDKFSITCFSCIFVIVLCIFPMR